MAAPPAPRPRCRGPLPGGGTAAAPPRGRAGPPPAGRGEVASAGTRCRAAVAAPPVPSPSPSWSRPGDVRRGQPAAGRPLVARRLLPLLRQEPPATGGGGARPAGGSAQVGARHGPGAPLPRLRPCRGKPEVGRGRAPSGVRGQGPPGLVRGGCQRPANLPRARGGCGAAGPRGARAR